MERIKVMIADDHSIVRQGLRQIIELESDIEVVAEATNGRQAVDYAIENEIDVILMDINMPILNGLQAIEELKSRGNKSKIIVITIHEESEYLFKTLKLGAEGYVLKDAESDVLLSAIRNVYKGQSFIQPNMTKDLVKEFQRVSLDNKSKEENNLTTRELEVLELIADGMINKEIAAKLYISEKTVKNHVSNIFKKLNVSDRTQAAIYAFKHNLKS